MSKPVSGAPSKRYGEDRPTFKNAVSNPRKARQIRCNIPGEEAAAIKSAFEAAGRPEPEGPGLMHNPAMVDWLRAVAVRQNISTDIQIDEPENINEGAYWPLEASLTYQEQEALLQQYDAALTNPAQAYRYNSETAQAFRLAIQEFINEII